jgi:transcriptional antiterminator RfaH
MERLSLRQEFPQTAEASGSTEAVSGRPSGVAWYCVRSQPRHEHIAAAHLRLNRRVEVFSPRIRFKRATRRGPVWVSEPLFPSYLFARFDWKQMLQDVQHTSGVAGVVHFGLLWPTVPDEVIAQLSAAVDKDETRVIEEVLHVGDEVQLAGGAFDGFHAVVTRVMPGRQRVAVLLEFLGRQTMVELDRSALRNAKAWQAVRTGCFSAEQAVSA